MRTQIKVLEEFRERCQFLEHEKVTGLIQQHMLLKTVIQLQTDKNNLKNSFRNQISQQMNILNENYEDILLEEKNFYKHLLGLQNKASYLQELLRNVKSDSENENNSNIERLETKINFVIKSLNDSETLNSIN